MLGRKLKLKNFEKEKKVFLFKMIKKDNKSNKFK